MHKIVICVGSSCFARGNEKNAAVAEKWLGEHGLQDEVDVDLGASLCMGKCADGPIVVVDGKTHTHVDEDAMRGILAFLFPDAARA